MYQLLAFAVSLLLLSASPALGCNKHSDCSDGDPCTIDTCDPVSRTCRHSAAIDGTRSDDRNACTQSDTCAGGRCIGGNPIVCAAEDQCHVGVCDPNTGRCSNAALPEGAACDDGDACTQTDTCQAGDCTGSNPVVCVPIDACHVAGTCDPATGVCSNPPKDPVVCSPVDQCAMAGTCNPVTGLCVTPPKPDGSPCDTGSRIVCSVPDSCQGGTCVEGGGGDRDGDHICDADDNCPDYANDDQGDLDQDGIGDVCDGNDAKLIVTSLYIRGSRRTGKYGSIGAKGKFLIEPASPTQSFDSRGGIIARVTDDLALDQTARWEDAECRSLGRSIACGEGKEPFQVKFSAASSDPDVIKFSMRFPLPADPAVLHPPISLTFTTHGIIDRVGTIGACRASASSMRCRQP